LNEYQYNTKKISKLITILFYGTFGELRTGTLAKCATNRHGTFNPYKWTG